MPLSNAEAAQLKRRRKKAKKLKAEIEKLVSQAGSQVKLPKLQAELNAALTDIAGLEAKQKALKQATALAKTQAIVEADAIQAAAVQQISSVYGASAAAVEGKFGLLGEALFIKDVQDLMSLAAQKRDATMLQAMRKTAAKAEMLNRELMVRTFGPEAVGNRARGLGLFLGGGIDLDVVDEIWATGPNARKGKGLMWLMRAQDKADSAALAGTLKQLISLGEDSRRSFGALKAAGFPDARMTKWADDLVKAAQGVIGAADPATRAAAMQHYERIRSKTRKYLATRKVGPLGTRGPGKKLIAELNKAVKTLDGDAAEAAAKTWIGKKSRYDATLATRSATNATYNEANTRHWKRNPAVYACRWVLSIRHPIQDVCNACADADFGLGPGVYKLGEYPVEHPQGLCRLEPVIDKDYLKTGVPKGWRPPADYALAVKGLDFDGPLRNTTRRKGASIPKILDEANLVRPPAATFRNPLVGPDGTLMTAAQKEAAEKAAKAKWLATPEGKAYLHSQKVKAGMAKAKQAKEAEALVAAQAAEAAAKAKAAQEAAEAAAKAKAAKEAAEKAAKEKAAKEAAEKAAKEKAAKEAAELKVKQKALLDEAEAIAEMPTSPAMQKALQAHQAKLNKLVDTLPAGAPLDDFAKALQSAQVKGAAKLKAKQEAAEAAAKAKAAQEAAEAAAKKKAAQEAAELKAKKEAAETLGVDVDSLKNLSVADAQAMAKAKLEQEAAEKAAKEAAEKAAKEKAEKEAAELAQQKAAKEGVEPGLKSQLDEVHLAQKEMYDDLLKGGDFDDDAWMDAWIQQQQEYAGLLADEQKVISQLPPGPAKNALQKAHNAKVAKFVDEFGVPEDLVQDLLDEAIQEGLELAAKAAKVAPPPPKVLSHGEKVQLGMAKKKAAAQKAKMEALEPGTAAYVKAEKAYNAAVAKAKSLGATDDDLLSALGAFKAQTKTTDALAAAKLPKVGKPATGQTPPYRLDQMREVPMDLKGMHAKMVYEAPDGSRWLVKPAYAGDDFMATAERFSHVAAQKLGIESAETYTVRLADGRLASMQRMSPKASSGLVKSKGAAGDWISALTPAEVRHIQREHLLDWIISNHDSHLENFIRGPDIDVLLGIDKGQAFKFWGRDKFNPIGYKPNPSRTVYDLLYTAHKGGRKIPGLTLDPSDFEDLWRGIREMVDDPKVIAALREYAEQRLKKVGPKPGFRTADEFIAAWKRRALGTRAEFEKFARELGGLPASPAAARKAVREGLGEVGSKAKGLTREWAREYEQIMDVLEDELAKMGGPDAVFMAFETTGSAGYKAGNKKAAELAERIAKRLNLSQAQWKAVRSAVKGWSGCSTGAAGKKFMRAINQLAGTDNSFWGMGDAGTGAIHRDYLRGMLLKRAMTARFMRHHKPGGWRMHRGWDGGRSAKGSAFGDAVEATGTAGVAPVKRVQTRTVDKMKSRPAASWTFNGNTTGFGHFRSSAWMDEHDDFWTSVWVDADLDRYAREAEIIVGRAEGLEHTWRMGAHGNVREVLPAGATTRVGRASPLAGKTGKAKPATAAAPTPTPAAANPYAKYDKYATASGNLNISSKFKAHMTPKGPTKTVTIQGTAKTLTVPAEAKFSKKAGTFVWWKPNASGTGGMWVKQHPKGTSVIKVIKPWPNTKTGAY